jgi:hypothetical protein
LLLLSTKFNCFCLVASGLRSRQANFDILAFASDDRRKTMNDSGQANAKSALAGRALRFGVIALGALLVLIAIFYLEENGRGKSAWNTSKNDLIAQHEVLDWSAYIPSPLPDEQNFFKAPKMAEWFVGKGSNELSSRLSLASFEPLVRQAGNTKVPVQLAQWILRTGAAQDAPASPLANFTFDHASLSNVLQQLAAAANLKIQIDPQASSSPSVVTISWTNVTAQAALLALVCNANLRWVENPATGIALITAADATVQSVGPDSASLVLTLLKKALGLSGESAENFALGADPILQLGTMQLSVPPDAIPPKAQIIRLFPGNAVLRVEPAGNALQIWLAPLPIAAADYLQWSDQFRPQFDLIREAVKRPASRIDGDYAHLDRVPSINFLAAEPAACVLADRAKCFLMLDQPELALAEVTLLHDFIASLARPGAKQISIPAAAGIATLRTLYGETVAFGLRSQAWNDSQLTLLEDQLTHVDLLSLVWNAMESDRAWRCHFSATASRSEVAQSVALGGPSETFSEKLRNYKYSVFEFMPQGWVYQNLARMASLRQGDIDALDRAAGVVHPHQAELALQRDTAAFRAASPFAMLAKLETPPLEPTLTTAARIQALINEAQVVTALERFRLARGVYPDRLEALAPVFIAVLPPDPISGQALHYRHLPGGRFLLYSIGWDEKDDNGAPLDPQGSGDWVWGGR